MEERTCDIIVLGGGPAGMTAAIYAKRANLDVVLLETNVTGGLVNSTYTVENFPSYPEIHGMELMEKMREHVDHMGVEVEEVFEVTGLELGEDEMEVGIGIHGEPGTHKEALRPADEIVDHILDKILADIDYTGHEVAVMVNSSGATPLMELFIINNHVADVLAAKGIKVYKTFVGEYMTSLEMEGFSVSLLRLDDELKALLDAHADTIAFKA